MFRKLLIVFASGLVLSIVAFGAAWVVGGEKLRNDIREGHGVEWHVGDDEDYKGPRKSRTFALAAGTQLVMEVPVELDFVRGDKAGMVVEGPTAEVDRLVFENGHLKLKDGGRDLRHGIKVRITAPQIAGLDFQAPGDVTLSGLDQDEMRLTSQSAIDLEAQGKVKRMFVTAEGAGNFDLGDVEAEDATVRMDGAGNVVIAATGAVDVVLNGVGNVSLLKKPRLLKSAINGIGTIDHDY